MTDTISWYGQTHFSAYNKEIDFNSDAIKLMATTSSYTPNKDTHRYKSDVTNEVSGTNYVAGGLTIPACTITYDSANDRVILDGDDANWAGAIPLCRNLVLYDSTPGSDATRPLICYIVLDADKQPSGVSWPAAGILFINS